MDVNLPGAFWDDREVSGADLAHILKTHPQTANLPIILVTAYAMLSEREAFLESSRADDFVAKPITDYEALLKLIDRLVHQNASPIKALSGPGHLLNQSSTVRSAAISRHHPHVFPFKWDRCLGNIQEGTQFKNVCVAIGFQRRIG